MNKNLLVVINLVLLALVGVLYYFHFTAKEACISPKTVGASNLSNKFTIAYFEMDSIENSYEYLVDVKTELKAKEDEMTRQLSGLKNQYMNKVNKFQQEAQSMSQEKQGQMQQDLMQEQNVIKNKEQSMGLELQDASFKKMQEVNKTIEEYLKDFNKSKGYAYILAHQPGTIYYKDTAYDITGSILKGLNELYKKKK